MPYWRLNYHFIWGTKNREPLILPAFETDLYRVIASKADELGAIVHAIGGIENHIHLIASVPPKIALSTFIGQVKGNSSHFVNHVIQPNFRFRWQAEYGVQSFDKKKLPLLVRYVQNQRKHHQDDNLIDLLEIVN
jgi:REP element-mobilizing transposase RayT